VLEGKQALMREKPMGLLGDRVALVTGASKGIGRAIALALAREGCDVAVSGRAAERLKPVAEKIERLGRQAMIVPADVSHRADVASMIEGVITRFGRMDILVNNAGGGIGNRLIEDTTVEEWDRVIALNLKAVFLTCQAAARHMIRQGSGRIINVASVAGKYKPLGLTSAAYCTAKSGVLGMTRHLTVLLAPHGIRVNSVLPDDVMTDDVRTWWEGLLEADRKELLRLNPAGRLATPEDIADFVVLLASDGSRFVTGENIGITGGRHMG
jgi:3-oxoacyl-[acyl-carrier protein] reductase